MTSMIKRVFLSLLIFINFLMTIAFLVSSYASYLHPKEFWFTGFLGLFFPYFLFSLLFFLVFWLFVKRWWALLSLIILIAGYRTILLHFPLNLNGDFQVNKEQQDVRLMSWNVRHFIPFDESSFKPDKLKHRKEVFEKIRK